MKKLLVLLVMFSLVCYSASAQSRLWKEKKVELSTGAGAAMFYGDFGGTLAGKNRLGIQDKTFLHTGLEVNGGLRFGIKRFSARLNLVLGGVSSSDQSGSEAAYFKSTTFFAEPSVTGEFFIVSSSDRNRYSPGKNKKSYHNRFSLSDLYVYAGIGGIGYTVTANPELTKLVTKSNGFTPVLPAGIGINFYSLANYKIGAELGGRYALNDLLDGYHSIVPGTEDMYYFINLNLTYSFKMKR